MTVRRQASRYVSLPNDVRSRGKGTEAGVAIAIASTCREILADRAADVTTRVVPSVGNH